MGAFAASSSNLILPLHPRAKEFAVTAGDTVTTLDGEHIGVVRTVTPGAFEISAGVRGHLAWLSRDDVFWADERGVVVAFGLDELKAHELEPPGLAVA